MPEQKLPRPLNRGRDGIDSRNSAHILTFPALAQLPCPAQLSYPDTRILYVKFRIRRLDRAPPCVKRGQGALADNPVPLLFVADFLAEFFLQRFQ